ncbi:MAG TPA: carbonic anhydrase [Anaerolineaceae bacterium]
MAELALERLMAGNRRFAAGSPLYPNHAPAHRQKIAAEQHPIATILGCADSRVPPEIIFDQGLGDLFTVRVGGNILDPATLGSLEFAVHVAGVRLVLVLGHSGCGAVRAALEQSPAPGQIAALVAAIQPAIDEAKRSGGDVLDLAVRINVAQVVQQLRTAEPILAPMVREGTLLVAGAVYDMRSGVVELVA